MPLRPGRATTADVELGPIRELVRADLSLLNETRPIKPLDSLRDNHHRIARALASGISNSEAAALCGIGYNRVSTLRQDPAFNELVAHYRSMITADWVANVDTVTEFLGSVRTKSLAMLEDKLCAAVDNNEFLPTRELVAMAELGLDRTGYGKVNKNINVNVDFAAQLEAARNRSSRARDVSSPPLSPIAEAPRPLQAAPASHSTPSMTLAPSQFRRRV
jgi:hypothetical protein